MAKFCSARSRTIPPLPWQTFALPFSPLPETFAYGIDIGKKVFHVVAVNRDGAVIQRAKFARETLHSFFDVAPKALIGMEACPGSQ